MRLPLASEEAAQLRGPFRVPGRQEQEESRVGAPELLICRQHRLFFSRMGGGGQKNRLIFRTDSLAALQQPLKLPGSRLIPVLEQAVIFQVAAEVQSVRGYAQLLQALIILGSASSPPK